MIRPTVKVIYPNDEKFELGKCKTIVKSDKDKLLVVSGGVILHEAL